MSPSFRLRLASAVEATVDGFPKPVRVTVIDLSSGGCRLRAASILLTGSEIRFKLPAGERNIPIVGKIRHNSGSSGNSLEYGVEFAKLAPDDDKVLGRFLEEERLKSAAADSAIRVETEFNVTCTVAGTKDEINALALDLSRGGMRLAFEKRIAEGSTLSMQFTLPNGEAARSLQVRGKVVHATQQFREFHHSVVFVDISPAIGDEIERVVRALRLNQR
ncbi:MAG: PilZ domain-containing protein [Candidatus Aquilonibacter sp.]